MINKNVLGIGLYPVCIQHISKDIRTPEHIINHKG